MQAQEITALLRAQKEYYRSGATLPIQSRRSALKTLAECIRRRREDILQALHSDLGKSATEGYMCEVGMALDEIGYLCRHLKKWSKPKRVRTPLAQFAAKSYRLPTPRGSDFKPVELSFSAFRRSACRGVGGGKHRPFKTERIFSRDEQAACGNRRRMFPQRACLRSRGRQSGKRLPFRPTL